MAEAFFFRVPDPIKLEHAGLFLIAVPDMLAVLPPAPDDRLHIEFPVGAHQRRSRLFPDQPRAHLEARILKGVVENARLHRGIKLIDGCILRHGILEIREAFYEKFIGLFVVQVVVGNGAGLVFQLHKIGGVRTDQIDPGVTEQSLEGFRQGRIAADDGMPAQMPRVAHSAKTGLF